MKDLHVAILGATGMVGQELLDVLVERKFPMNNLTLLSSARSAGSRVLVGGKEYAVEQATPEAFKGVDVAFFAAGGQVSQEWVTPAVEAGALIINDISNLSADPMMAECVAELSRERGAGVVLNHTRGTPLTMQLDPQYADAVSEVRDELLASANRLEELGMERERICLDPGIGFGKSLDHNLQLIAQLQELCVTGYPVLVGLSYKSLFGKIEALADSDRKIPSIAGAMMADLLGARVVRVHDVAESAEAFAFLNELRARGGVEFSPPFVISKNERG